MALGKRDDVVIRYGGDATGFQKATRKVSKAASGIKKTFSGVGSSIAGAFGIGTGVAAGGIVASLAKLTQDLNALGKTAQSLNVTVESLSALRFAISQTSTLTDQQLNLTLQKLVKHVGQANRGLKSSQDLFKEMGLDVEYLAGLKSDQVFLEIADAIKRIPNAYDQASLAQKLFEDNWRAIIPTLQEGREGLEGLMNQAIAMGVPTNEAAEAAANLEDSIGRLNQAMSGMATTYGPPVIEFLSHYIEVVTESTGATDKIGQLTDQINLMYQEIEQVQGKGFIGSLVRFTKTDEQVAKKVKELSSELGDLIKQRQILIDQKAASPTKDLADVTGIDLGTGGEKAKPKKGGKGKSLVEETTDWRDKTVEEIGKALNEFREGKITATQLGERAGLQAPGTAEATAKGAYGTQSNTLANQGAIGAGGTLITGPDKDHLNAQFEAYFAEREFDLKIGKLLGEGATIQLTPDTDLIRNQIQQNVFGEPFLVQVKAELIGAAGIERVAQDEADKRGSRQ